MKPKHKVDCLWEDIKKLLDKPPKIKVIPLKQTKDEKLKAQLLTKILHENWYVIENRIQNEIYKPMVNCFLFGQHKWAGCGKKDKHICKRCGWETWVGNDPIYDSQIEVYWDKRENKT